MADRGLGVARIAGRISAVRRLSRQGGSEFRTVLKLPAVDQYSSPATVEVRSGERVGSIGDEVSIDVRVGGYPRSYRPKDDPDAQAVTTAENVLQFAGAA